jgi:hypothetical protein
MSDSDQQKSRPWLWWAVAVGLLPISLAMFWAGLSGAWTDQPGFDVVHLAWGLVLILSPIVALVGVVWIVVLCVLADRRQAARWNRNTDRHPNS